MENTSFWQNVVIVVIGLLQQMVALVIWEKHQAKPDPVDNMQNKL